MKQKGELRMQKVILLILKNKVTDMFKEHFPGAEQHFEDFFKQNSIDDGKSGPTKDINPGA